VGGTGRAEVATTHTRAARLGWLDQGKDDRRAEDADEEEGKDEEEDEEEDAEAEDSDKHANGGFLGES
jgi:hypothetical protein